MAALLADRVDPDQLRLVRQAEIELGRVPSLAGDPQLQPRQGSRRAAIDNLADRPGGEPRLIERAVEGSPAEQGGVSIWHRGPRGRSLVGIAGGVEQQCARLE